MSHQHQLPHKKAAPVAAQRSAPQWRRVRALADTYIDCVYRKAGDVFDYTGESAPMVLADASEPVLDARGSVLTKGAIPEPGSEVRPGTDVF